MLGDRRPAKTMKLFRNQLGEFRNANLFERHFKLPNKVALYLVLIPYALYGIISCYHDIKTQGQKIFNEITHAKTYEIGSVANDNLVEGDDPSVEERNADNEISTCNEWADEWGKVYQVNPNLLKKIIDAESKNNEKAKNPNSTASSCAQFIYGTWYEKGLKLWGDEFYSKNVWSAKDNVELMTWLISEEGTGAWDASKNVWSK